MELKFYGTRLLKWNGSYGTEVLSVGTQFCGTRMLRGTEILSVGTEVLWNSIVEMELKLWN